MEKFYKRKGDDAIAAAEGYSAPEPEHEPLALVAVEQPRQNEEQQPAKPVIFQGIEFLERYFRVEIFRAALDSQLNELNLKFNEKVMGLLSISSTLILKHGFSSFNAKDICKMVGKYYPADFTQQDIIGLEHQLNHFAHDAFNGEDLKISTLTTLCRCLVVTGRHMIYNLLDRLLRLLITLLVSTASAECAFSSLKIIKTRLRNKMEDDYLANSLLLQVEREIAAQYNYDDIMADFKARKNRRATL